MSSRSFSGLLAASFVTALTALTGCSSSGSPAKESVDSYESELRLAVPRYLGPIAAGDTKNVSYTNPPKYRAYGFTAKAGDQITADVQSVNGDAMGWITSSTYEVLAANDDASADTLDSQVTYTVPAGTASRAYRIVFRDYDLGAATFNVTLSVASASAPTCSYDGATYNAGDSFPATDGCNTCSCASSGNATCTKKACTACDPDNEPWRNYRGTPTTCQLIRYACPATQRSFQNACGCGCEALSH